MGRAYTMLLLLAATLCHAQEDTAKVNQLTVDLQVVAHGEACIGGLPRADDSDLPSERKSFFLFGRNRFIVDYQRPGLQAHAVIQNKAVWGTSGNQSLNLYEGWVKFSHKSGLFAQLGRIALAYDDERIIGTNDFATAALSHDVLRLGYEGHGHQVHAILAYNQTGDKVYKSTYYDGGSQSYKTMQTLWYHYDLPHFPLGVSLLFMNIGMQAGVENDSYNPPKTEYNQMFGGYAKYDGPLITAEAAYYRQTGKMVNKYMQTMPIRAWMASAKVVVKPLDCYGLFVGYDHLSGDDYVPVIYGGNLGMVRHEQLKGFTPIYGSRTSFYGIMDYFYASAHSHGFTPGLQNAFLGGYVKPVSALNIKAAYHYLAVATDLTDLNRTLGHSIELEASYRFSKDVALSAGYTFMVGTETMDRLKQQEGDKYARWGWFSLAVSPRLFSTKW